MCPEEPNKEQHAVTWNHQQNHLIQHLHPCIQECPSVDLPMHTWREQVHSSMKAIEDMKNKGQEGKMRKGISILYGCFDILIRSTLLQPTS